jgi:hypothetical protein
MKLITSPELFRVAHCSYWKAFARMYAVYSIVYMTNAVPNLYKQYTVDGKNLSTVLGAFLIFGALQFAVRLALWLYSLMVNQHSTVGKRSI